MHAMVYHRVPSYDATTIDIIGQYGIGLTLGY
jgi:hypothetical protein